jgi:transcription elongation factor GreB
MSKAFTKDDQEDAPLVLPRRPSLPPGSSNYVTPRGLAALREEHARLESMRVSLAHASDARAAGELLAELADLADRIASAVVVDPALQPRNEARFGARVTVRTEEGALKCYEIVGIDEANAAEGRIAFVAPIARALLGKRVGDVVAVVSPRASAEIELVAIEY